MLRVMMIFNMHTTPARVFDRLMEFCEPDADGVDYAAFAKLLTTDTQARYPDARAEACGRGGAVAGGGGIRSGGGRWRGLCRRRAGWGSRAALGGVGAVGSPTPRSFPALSRAQDVIAKLGVTREGHNALTLAVDPESSHDAELQFWLDRHTNVMPIHHPGPVTREEIAQAHRMIRLKFEVRRACTLRLHRTRTGPPPAALRPPKRRRVPSRRVTCAAVRPSLCMTPVAPSGVPLACRFCVAPLAFGCVGLVTAHTTSAHASSRERGRRTASSIWSARSECLTTTSRASWGRRRCW